MGVINVTPDSFSDGGLHLDVERGGRRRRWGMLDEGAAIVDVGGESTRPGSDGVSAERGAASGSCRCSIDLAALAGLDRHLEGRGRAARARARRRARQRRHGSARRSRAGRCRCRRGRVSLPHAHAGRAADDAGEPRYDDVVSDVKRFLEERLAFAVAAGIPEERVCLDPGIGFGKTVAHNFELVRRLDELRRARPAGAGRASRARAARASCGRPTTSARLPCPSAAAVAAFERGATILRVHDVREHVEALTAAKAVRGDQVELRGLRCLRPPRRGGGGAAARPALPVRRGAGGRGARRRRPARGRGRLHAGRRGRA